MNYNMLRDRKSKENSVTQEYFEKFNEENKFIYNEFFDSNKQLSEKTLEQYHSGLKLFFYWVYEKLKNKSFYLITKRDFLKYISYLTESGMSSSGINFKKSSVSTLCNFAENILSDDIKEYKNFKNFTRGLPSVSKTTTYDKIPLSENEYNTLINELIKNNDYISIAWLATAYNCGARRAEIMQFKTEIVKQEMSNNTNYVLSNVVRGKGKGRDGKPIKFMINDEALKYIKLFLNNKDFDSEYIFSYLDNNIEKKYSLTWSNDLCRNKFAKIIGRRINPHLFKATCITHLLENGNEISVVSKYIAHHENVSTTMSFYDLRDDTEAKNEIFTKRNK